jgi:hypothetical protein
LFGLEQLRENHDPEEFMATAAITNNFVEVVANEIASGVDRAVECWLAQIDHALADNQLTTMGRLDAIQDVIRKYKNLTGKIQLKSHVSGHQF